MRQPMRIVAVVLLSAALGVSSAFLVACGDRNALIPKEDAAAIRSDLDKASSNVAAEECREAEADVGRAKDKAAALPAEVDGDLTGELDANLDVVLEDIDRQCGKTQTTQ